MSLDTLVLQDPDTLLADVDRSILSRARDAKVSA